MKDIRGRRKVSRLALPESRLRSEYEVMKAADITLIGWHFPHHAAHSGYDRLSEYLNIPVQLFPGVSFPVNRLCLSYIDRCYILEAALHETRVAFEMSRKTGTHLVHFLYGENSYRASAALCNNPSIKWIATFHQPPSILAETGIDANVVQGLTAVVLMGRTQIGFFEKLGAKHIHIIPHGIDCSYYSPSAQLRHQFRILTVGHWLRDFDMYFKVAEAAVKRNLPLQFRLITRNFAPNRITPSNFVIRHSVADEELLSEYNSAACFYHPLLDATANNALLEAFACGLPAVVSDKGSIRDYVGNRGEVILCKEDVEEHLSALLLVSSIGKDYRQRSSTARETAISYDWNRIARAYESLYE